MNKITTSTAVPTRALKLEALSNIVASFECEKAPNTDPGVNQIQCIDVIEFSRRDPGSQSAPMGPHPLANFQSYFKKVTRPRVGSAFGADSHPARVQRLARP